MSDCIFCKIIAGEIPSATIFENEELKVILDVFPANKGHVLVLPKKHVEDVFEIDEELAGRLFKLVTRLAKAMEGLEFAEGLNILQNNKEIAGQTVNHFHMHIIPRFKGDEVKIAWKTMSYADNEMSEYLDTIKKLFA